MWPDQPRMPLPMAGIHRFTRVSGDVHVCEGPGAPVILHYACSSFPAWRRKYEMLTTKPRFAQARQHSLGELPLSDEARRGTSRSPMLALRASPSASHSRDVDQLIPVHALAAQVLRSGEHSTALHIYRQTICMPDVLPALASRGLLLAVDHVAQLISRLSCDVQSAAMSEEHSH